MKNSRISIQLGSKVIFKLSKPYIIAEIGVNHEGSMHQAKKLISLAKEGGADAAKFQTYKADTLASKHSPSYWDTTKEPTTSQHELFQKYDNFEKEDYFELSEYCRSIEIDFISTPFDNNSVDYLDSLMPFYKIASADITNIPLLRKIAKKEKPVILSTGASNLEEIDLALKTLNSSGCKEVALLHCILNYPTPFEKANLNMIKGLKQVYPNNIIGYSDHTLPDNAMSSLVAAYTLGAVIIEKHFTDDKSLPGNDHYHAMDVEDLKCFLKIINNLYNSLGSSIKKPIKSEQISRLNARRSIVLKRNIQSGHKLEESDITYKRPGTGISTLYWDEVIGRELNKDLLEDDILQWEYLK